ncbi:MAG TPA: hypothetical protein VFN67_13155 [Polyangiales bacterium]|nr:hypothetical protein [Polyangiales bacterium]
MGMIIAFYAVPPGAVIEPANALGVAARCRQVASISVNSRAVGDVLTAFSSTLLAPLVGDADVVARTVHIPRGDFGIAVLHAAMLRAQLPADDALCGVSETIDEAVAEAQRCQTDLLVTAQ